MLASLDRRVVGREVEAFLPGEDRLVLGTVIFKNAANVLEPRHRQQHDHEKQHSDHPVDEIEREP